MRSAFTHFVDFPTERIWWVGLTYSQLHKQYFWADGTVAYIDEKAVIGNHRGTDIDYCMYHKRNKLHHGRCSDKLWFACEVKICANGWKYNPYTNRCTKLFTTAKSAVDAAWDCHDNEAILETFRDLGALHYYRSNLEHSVFQNDLWAGMSDQGEEDDWWWMDGIPVQWESPLLKPASNNRRDNCAMWKGNTDGALQIADCFNR